MKEKIYTAKRKRKPYERLVVYSPSGQESMTVQEHAISVDINHIIEKYDRTGELPHTKPGGTYGDVSEISHANLLELQIRREAVMERLTEIEEGLQFEKTRLEEIEAEKEQRRVEEVERAKAAASGNPVDEK